MLENGGIGYEIHMPNSSAAYLAEPDTPVTVYTFMAVREDDISLYGFDDRESLDIFRMLTTVSGVGNKAAISILSTLSAGEVKKAVMFEDKSAFVRAPGIGKKSASRIILELKDKIKDVDVSMTGGSPAAAPAGSGPDSVFEDAVAALMSLGYTRGEAADAAAPYAGGDASAEDIIKAALKKLSRF